METKPSKFFRTLSETGYPRVQGSTEKHPNDCPGGGKPAHQIKPYSKPRDLGPGLGGSTNK